MDNRQQFFDKVLPYVRKPNRYTGSELNVIRKEKVDFRWALAFPDLYEIGMSHLGMGILYHRINSLSESISAERVFLPDMDAIERMRLEGLSLSTLETYTPLNKVDILGFSLNYELSLPAVLEMLDLGSIPVLSADREENDPIVVAGGPLVFNPEPLADFIDLFVIGDGEEIVHKIILEYLSARKNSESRIGVLRRLAQIPGIYYPAGYNVAQDSSGRTVAAQPDDISLPKVVKAEILHELKAEYYPSSPLVPMIETVHDRITLEIMRGCTSGCRFCHAGNVYRPVREREVQDIVNQAMKNIESTGWNEISLLSLSTSDYNDLVPLLKSLRETFRGMGIHLSFPSLRAESFTEEMLNAFPEGRKGGITFAPEAGTQRLRGVINKHVKDEDILKASKLAYENEYNGVKLYYMIGLPTETIDDLDAIVDLSLKVAGLRKRKSQKISVSVNAFAPKSHTPFQWHKMESIDEIRKKSDYIRNKLKGTVVRFSGNDPAGTWIESAISRGDRNLGKVLYQVWKSGGIREAWSDQFSPERWWKAFREAGLRIEDYTQNYLVTDQLPWNHISKGITHKFSEQEWNRSVVGESLADCRHGECNSCGLQKFIEKNSTVCNRFIGKESKMVESIPLKEAPRKLPGGCGQVLRLRYSRDILLRWTGHLDIVRMWDRAIQRSKIPVAYSQGFHPHQKVSFGPPLPLGLVSEDEYIDIELAQEISLEDVVEDLRPSIAGDITLLAAAIYDKKPGSLSSTLRYIDYSFSIDAYPGIDRKIKEWLELESYPIERTKRDKTRTIDIRAFVESIEQQDDTVRKIRLRVNNGSMARLTELGLALADTPNLFINASRTAVFIDDNGTICRPMESKSNPPVLYQSLRRIEQ